MKKNCLAVGLILVLSGLASAQPLEDPPHPLRFIDTALEHASPLWWELDADGVVQIHLVYDQERSSPNRANGHWLFRIGSDVGDTDRYRGI